MEKLPITDKYEFRCDDVLLVAPLTGSMKDSLRHNTFFGHFLEFDKILQKYNLSCTLTVLAAGIPVYPEWVEYIKKNQHRYKIEMHGYIHQTPPNLEETVRRLAVAKRMINDTFNVEITRWYVPFGRRAFPDWGQEACRQLGIKFHSKVYAGDVFKPQKYYHYWNSRDRDRLKMLLENYEKGVY